jgi:hypothetical protein
MLNRCMGVAAGVAVTYCPKWLQFSNPYPLRRVTPQPIVLADGQVWVGRTAFASNDVGKARVQWGDRDYLILAAALPAGLGPPFEGDALLETVNGVPCRFEVLQPDTGEPPWRWADESRTVYRLHVKQQEL